MRFTMEINTDNDAFDSPDELPNILRGLADRLSWSEESGRVLDSNGNTVGQWEVTA